MPCLIALDLAAHAQAKDLEKSLNDQKSLHTVLSAQIKRQEWPITISRHSFCKQLAGIDIELAPSIVMLLVTSPSSEVLVERAQRPQRPRIADHAPRAGACLSRHREPPWALGLSTLLSAHCDHRSTDDFSALAGDPHTFLNAHTGTGAEAETMLVMSSGGGIEAFVPQ